MILLVFLKKQRYFRYKRGLGAGTAFSLCMGVFTVGLALIIATARLRVNLILAEEQAWDPTQQMLITILQSTIVVGDEEHKAILPLYELMSLASMSNHHIMKIEIDELEKEIDLNKILEEKLKTQFKVMCANRCHFVLTLNKKDLIAEYPRINTMSYREYLEGKGVKVTEIKSAWVPIALTETEKPAYAYIQLAEVA